MDLNAFRVTEGPTQMKELKVASCVLVDLLVGLKLDCVKFVNRENIQDRE